jgi:hypothetical protein
LDTYLALALGAEAGLPLPLDLAVLGQVVLQREDVDVAHGVEVNLVALQLARAAAALQFAGAGAVSL